MRLASGTQDVTTPPTRLDSHLFPRALHDYLRAGPFFPVSTLKSRACPSPFLNLGSMEAKQFEVVCPCCTNRLTIDTRTQKVLRSRPKEQVDETGKPKLDEQDWSQAFGKVKAR